MSNCKVRPKSATKKAGFATQLTTDNFSFSPFSDSVIHGLNLILKHLGLLLGESAVVLCRCGPRAGSCDLTR
jgi:hypothetical protein